MYLYFFYWLWFYYKSLGNTALHDAAEIGNLEIIYLLVDAGATMQKDDYGVTPLLTASLHGHTVIMQTLFIYASAAEKRDAWKLHGLVIIFILFIVFILERNVLM